MSLLRDWKHNRERRKHASVYLAAINHDIPTSDIAWLAQLMPPGSERAAGRELLFARRAVGLIVAERDALDDQTASDVAHELAPVISAEARRDDFEGQAWAERWRSYTAAIAARGLTESPAVRLARVMLAGAGVANPAPAALDRATGYITALRASANDALREAFGSASLPDDVRPSAVGTAIR